MARSDTVYVCQSCGAVHAKWAGRCDACGAWNSLVEEAGASAPLGSGAARPSPARSSRRSRLELVDLGSESPDPPRLVTGIAELDRVAGGGLVPGSAILVGGDPGIGKSTLLLQAAARLAASGASAVYVSGEEASAQVRRRARRLGLA
ncbi:MAG: AAA family ATPase, partial [Oceanicaulis sp.]|nr:AAA family ATPase [Oceanicaulis sp.]